MNEMNIIRSWTSNLEAGELFRGTSSRECESHIIAAYDDSKARVGRNDFRCPTPSLKGGGSFNKKISAVSSCVAGSLGPGDTERSHRGCYTR